MTLAELPADNDPPVTFNSWRDCVAAMPVRIENNDGARIQMSTRTVARRSRQKRAGILTGSRVLPVDPGAERDFATWRNRRGVGGLWNGMDYPELHVRRGGVGEGLQGSSRYWPRTVQCPGDHGYHTLFDMHYCRTTPKCARLPARSNVCRNGMMTRITVSDDCETGRHLGDEIAHRSWKTSKRLMKMLAMKSHTYSFLFHLHGMANDLEQPSPVETDVEAEPLVGIGPTPRMKAEAFEAGLPIDDIDGLDPATRDAELRRYENG